MSSYAEGKNSCHVSGRAEAPRNEVEQSEEVIISLYDLYSGDLSEQMLSFASIHDLRTFDALSKKFQALTESRWEELVYEKTGMPNGKADIMRYASFLREPISVELVDEADHGYGCGFAGSVHVATSDSLIVMVTDDTSGDMDERTYPSIENEVICVRDAYSLNFSRLVSSPIRSSWRACVCGRVGSEIIVTSNAREVAAIRGNDTQLVRHERQLRSPNGILLLSCETHLIVCIGNFLKLYRVETDTVSAELLSFKQSVVTTRENDQNMTTDRDDVAISWGSDKSSFVYCRGNEISVWRLDVANDTLNQVKLIDYGEDEEDADLEIDNVALGDDFIVGSSTQRDIHIWNRSTGEKLPHVLCDIDDENDRLDPDDIIRELVLWCCGDILISSSHLGNKLCIWDVKSGELLKEHVLELDGLPDGNALTSLAYLPHLNGFMLVTSHFTTFISFPTNKRQKEMAKSIRRRELHSATHDMV